MHRLRFVGLAEDGAHLVVSTGANDCFLLPIDEALRSAVRGANGQQQQQRLPLPTPIRPREIQARVRAGETPEQVAAGSGMSVERVMRFAYPVLAERAQVVEQARRARVRRDTAAPTLDERLAARLEARGVNPAAVTWDSHKREDGTWLVVASWRSAERDRSATWMFELTTKVLVPEDDLAQHLTGEEDRPFTGRLTPVTPLAAAARAAAGGEHQTEPIPSVADLVPTRHDPPEPAPGEPDQGQQRRTRVPAWEEILLGPRRT